MQAGHSWAQGTREAAQQQVNMVWHTVWHLGAVSACCVQCTFVLLPVSLGVGWT
jgi:hypothetical protein